MTKQELAIKGVMLISSIMLFLFCTTISVWCMNRERNRSAIFWLVISAVCAILMFHFSTYFN